MPYLNGAEWFSHGNVKIKSKKFNRPGREAPNIFVTERPMSSPKNTDLGKVSLKISAICKNQSRHTQSKSGQPYVFVRNRRLV